MEGGKERERKENEEMDKVRSDENGENEIMKEYERNEIRKQERAYG